MRRDPFITGNFYHIYNRGVDKRVVFNNEKNFFRFVHDLYVMNDINAVAHSSVRFNPKIKQARNLILKREPLVDIVSWCLMPNHFHLVLRQRIDGGISLFMQKLGTGYTMYFNTSHERTGALFQGRFKSKLVDNDVYMMHIIRYVHINPVSLIEPGWEQDGIKDWPRAIEFLSKYRWSSHLDYIGIKNFPSLLNREQLPKYSEIDKQYSTFLQIWLTQNPKAILRG